MLCVFLCLGIEPSFYVCYPPVITNRLPEVVIVEYYLRLTTFLTAPTTPLIAFLVAFAVSAAFCAAS